MLDGPQLPNNPVDTLLHPGNTKLLRALLGPYCHPTVISLFLSVVCHVDNTGGRCRGERTKADDDGEASDRNTHEPGKMHRVLGSDVATMRARQHIQPWEAGACGPAGAGLALAAGGRRD